MSTKMNIDEVKDYIRNSSDSTKIYLGADSERFKKHGIWFAQYTLAVVVHIDGKHGCKVFGESVQERDYDQNKDRPRMRLMNEAMKVADLYLSLADVIEDRGLECEIHLDINPNKKHGSSCVINEAVGYIKGSCNMTPKVKPAAFAASYTADRLMEILQMQKKIAADTANAA